ncbi:hypothetical protein RH594_003004 [Listeria monocytogenes]|nr:hypothetical protein [Listeria monocytogenes]EAD7838640.1 hypothetical protein [Listeria monocytogenes]EAE7988196.1 hypothetical protein [Listeria monocytogenes]EAE8110538.1 hypothetical protein [Listeria monocytogenes]ELB7125496.1 hypothetical protein [Listeria monocytogenes]
MTYRDRGMQKWQGMILSEHTEQLEQAKRKLSWLPQQSEECLVEILSYAVTKQHAITIQRLTEDENGYPLPFVMGRIAGVEDDRIYIRDMAGEITVLTFDDLNHISERTIEKWYR